MSDTDRRYVEIILNRIRRSQKYRPAFGQGQPVSFQEFQQLYRSDPFYTWFGLDDPLIYTAHRAAGGLTSIYRQIGLGCEELFRQILQDTLELTAAQVQWSYQTITPGGRKRTLSLDGRIAPKEITSVQRREIVSRWLSQAAHDLHIAPEITKALKGAVFEVRQGYKSKDSKRQNADLANAATAYSQGYLPVLFVLSTQIDNDIVGRYEQGQWLILQGYTQGSPTHSTYVFMREIIGYDLAAFFKRNAPLLRKTITDILHILLEAEDNRG
jgi:hypothetical protein